MKINKSVTTLAIGGAMLLSAPFARAINITIADNNSGTIISGTLYNETSAVTGGSAGDQRAYWRGQSGPAGEYHEVEPGMIDASYWDLAAFVNPTPGKLGVVSGYNLSGVTDNTTIGDIFVNINNSPLTSPYIDPNGNYSQFAANSTYGWDFAVHMDFSLNKYFVYQLDANTILRNGEYFSQNYNAASQPWKVASASEASANGGNTGTLVAQGTLFYSSSFASTINANVSDYTGYAVDSAYKYYAQIDTGWLNSYGTTAALYKLTMECGNDNMLGLQSSGFQQVPDGSATVSLLGMTLLALAGVTQFRIRRVAS